MSRQPALPEPAQDASCCEPTELDIGFHTLQLACVQNRPVKWGFHWFSCQLTKLNGKFSQENHHEQNLGNLDRTFQNMRGIVPETGYQAIPWSMAIQKLGFHDFLIHWIIPSSFTSMKVWSNFYRSPYLLHQNPVVEGPESWSSSNPHLRYRVHPFSGLSPMFKAIFNLTIRYRSFCRMKWSWRSVQAGQSGTRRSWRTVSAWSWRFWAKNNGVCCCLQKSTH